MSKRHVAAPLEELPHGHKRLRQDPDCLEIGHFQTEEASTSKSPVKPQAWKQWGPYLSERQWATLREDLSEDGNSWDYLSYVEASYTAYQWGEDGLLGICDEEAQLCLALVLWNGKDSCLKERLFGLTQHQGNHGEDVKECYYYQDCNPTYSYMKALYKYPHGPFPYEELLQENAKRSRKDPEYELIDTGVFDEGNYWDVQAEYAKVSEEDILCKWTVTNRGSLCASLHILPTVWFRNTWSGHHLHSAERPTKPYMRKEGQDRVMCYHHSLGERMMKGHPHDPGCWAACLQNAQVDQTYGWSIKAGFIVYIPGQYEFIVEERPEGKYPDLLFTNNETEIQVKKQTTVSATAQTVLQAKSISSGAHSGETPGLYKGAVNHLLLKGTNSDLHKRLQTAEQATKCAALYVENVDPKQSVIIRCCLRRYAQSKSPSVAFGTDFENIFIKRKQETEEFYKQVLPPGSSVEEQAVCRQAYAGLLWGKQFYYYNVLDWLALKSNKSARHACNRSWEHMKSHDIISMPDKWEFPWFAVWDLAFHMVPMADVDPDFAKSQLLLFLTERYMKANGQLPAYEYNFSDVNPPVHAWACMQVYNNSGQNDQAFLKLCFQGLQKNFEWWVSEKAVSGMHIYSGGFLGMDNISCVDRSNMPHGAVIKQADGTGWVAVFTLSMLDMAIALGEEEKAIYYLDHFTSIAADLNGEFGLWEETAGFYFDHVICKDRDQEHVLGIHSMVGLVPLFATTALSTSRLQAVPLFKDRLLQVEKQIHQTTPGVITKQKDCYLLSLVSLTKLRRMLPYMLDDQQFLSPYGIRALSKIHEKKPFSITLNDIKYTVDYNPGDSESVMFGGNSNWRGPVWVCMNYLLIQSLETYGTAYGSNVRVVFPTGSRHEASIKDVALSIAKRIVSIFLSDNKGHRPVHGGSRLYAEDAHWKDLVLFYEYFNGDTGQGHGASHQTGWTALVASLIRKIHTH